MAQGYDHQFVEQTPQNLICLICLHVARDPQQVNCCGKLLCRGCLTEHKKRSSNCPHCRGTITSFADRRSQLEILSLRARCDNSGNGCEWDGELHSLDEHMDTCDFKLIPCPNQCYECGNASKVVQLFRSAIKNHIMECPRRQYECPYCQKAGEYRERTTTHFKECPMIEVPCPRQMCKVRTARCNLPKHSLECMFEKVSCKYATIGCKEEVLRKDLGEHEGDSEKHIQLAVDTVHRLQIKQDDMQARLREMPMTHKFTDYEQHKTKNNRLYSPAFYTSTKGYKMCISMDPNGVGEGKGTHVSVGAYLMKGENDDLLTWPFTGVITVELLNQLEDKNHKSMTMTFPPNEEAGRQVVDEERSSKGWGMQQYIPHSDLGYNAAKNCRYLRDDCLYFRISVEVKSSSKTWLI